ncbi:MAG TPA: glycoside hydrolase family 88 protein [Terracidiphilus sp.]|nr:glycoside hydrolase family 88 protein [Terracidiphilus sp.]
MKILLRFAVLAACLPPGAALWAQQQPWSVRAASAAMDRWPAGSSAAGGGPAGEGVLLDALHAVWLNTVDRPDYEYIKRTVDPLIGPDGSLKAGDPLAEIQLGRSLLLLYGVTLNKRYFNAATALYQQLQTYPSDAPEEMAEAEPFLAEYALTFHHPEAFADISKQIAQAEQVVGVQGSGRGRADSGSSARRVGWLMAALVDTLPYLPEDDPGRTQLIAILNRDASAVARYRDAKTAVWARTLGKAGAAGNPPDDLASCLFVYALAKGVRRGYLPERYDAAAQRGYQGLLSSIVMAGSDGSMSLTGGADSDDPASYGAFILASTEAEHMESAKLGRGDTVMVDGWFNSQKRTDPTGREVYFHYKWDDQSNPGYSLWGHIFRNFGAHTATLYAEPTAENLRQAQVFIVASPDNLDTNRQAHFPTAEDAAQIAKWVKAGDVFVIMENDPSLADQTHFDVISDKFGIHFNDVLRMHVVGTDHEMGEFQLDGNGPIFHHPLTVFVKDVCTISVKPPAVPVYTHDGDIFMAVARYGKGTVYAMVDPWFYNEYTNGLKLPAMYDNYGAGVELARWILEQVPKQAAQQAAATVGR